MNRLAPHELPGFLRKYRLSGGRLRRVCVRAVRPRQVAVEFSISIRETVKQLGTTPDRLRLKLRLEGVDEFRFQMRPGQPRIAIAEARIGYLNGLFFVNLDAWALDPGEQAKIHDYRASEVYAAGRELYWSEVRRPNRDDPAG